MVFFPNTSRECWLTNAPKNLAIALWVIYKKKKQWNKTLLWGQYFFLIFFFFFAEPHWLVSFFLLNPAFAGLFLCPGLDVSVSVAQKRSTFRCGRRAFRCINPAALCQALDAVPGIQKWPRWLALTHSRSILCSAEADRTSNVLWAGLNKGLWLPVFSEGEKWRREKLSDSFRTLWGWKWC